MLCHGQESRCLRSHYPDWGCAKNEGLKQAIEKVLRIKVIDLPIDPQLMGALGAAEFARQKGRAGARA